MKILHIINNMDVAGAQGLLIDLVPAQIKMGNNVSILQLTKSNSDILLKKAMTNGIDVFTASQKFSIYNPLLIFRIIPFLKGVDIVNVHLDPASYWVAAAKLLSFSKTPIVYTVHSCGGHKCFDGVMMWFEKYVYKLAYSDIIACSEKAREVFQARFPSTSISLVSNGVDITKYTLAQSYKKKDFGVDDDSIVVTMVSRFAFMKRQETLVEALAYLPSTFHVFLVGGDGGNLENVRRIAKEKWLLDRVHFLGQRADVPRILKTSDIIVLASNYEGLSLSSIEGMAAGKPFIASDVDGLREIVKDAGVLFENGNSKELSIIIQRLVDNKNYYNEISNRCEKKASEFDIKLTAKNYIKQYTKVLG